MSFQVVNLCQNQQMTLIRHDIIRLLHTPCCRRFQVGLFLSKYLCLYIIDMIAKDLNSFLK